MPDKRRKVLYLSRGGDVSGAQRQLYYLLRGMDRRRFIPRVVCTEEGPFLDELREIDVPCTVRRLAGWRKVKHLLARYREVACLRDLVRAERISLVHGSDVWFSEYVRRAAEARGVPSILHVRAPVSQRTVDKYRCATATALVAISKRVEVRLAALKGIPREKIVLIHDAVDPEHFGPREQALHRDILRKEYNVHDSVLVGIVGRVEKQKEQLSFVRIARRVLDETNRAVFFIIGEMKDRAYCAHIHRYLSNHGLLSHVHFTGRREDIGDVLADLDVLVSLSGGSVRYEAMMCGLPVVCAWSRTSEESYHIRHRETGFLVAHRQEQPVAQVLTELVEDDPLRRRVGDNARRWAQQHLGHATLVESTQRLYEELLACSETVVRSARRGVNLEKSFVR